jgi:hypothetical protein
MELSDIKSRRGGQKTPTSALPAQRLLISDNCLVINAINQNPNSKCRRVPAPGTLRYLLLHAITLTFPDPPLQIEMRRVPHKEELSK